MTEPHGSSAALEFVTLYGAPPTRAALALLQQKYVIPVLHALLGGPKGFNELLRTLDGAGRATLADRLEQLEAQGLLTRTVESVQPPRTRYDLTEAGRATRGVLQAIEAWARVHLPHEPEPNRPQGRPLWLKMSAVFQEKWALGVMCELLDGPRGFNEMSRNLGVNVTTLGQRLARLEGAGVVRKHVLSEMPPKVRYEATQAGRDFGRVLDAVVRWANRNLNVTPAEQQSNG